MSFAHSFKICCTSLYCAEYVSGSVAAVVAAAAVATVPAEAVIAVVSCSDVIAAEIPAALGDVPSLFEHAEHETSAAIRDTLRIRRICFIDSSGKYRTVYQVLYIGIDNSLIILDSSCVNH